MSSKSTTPQKPAIPTKKLSNKKPKRSFTTTATTNTDTCLNNSTTGSGIGGSSCSTTTGTTTHQRAEPPFPLYTGTSDISNLDMTSTGKNTANKQPSFQQGWDSVVQLLRGRKRIAILTGAGISVSCGIPDFRTKGSGLYSTLDTAVCCIPYKVLFYKKIDC
jgi:hypothetical protein